MSYYIKYPKDKSRKVSVVTQKPKRGIVYGFAEGPLRTKTDVTRRLNQMGIHKKRRPANFL